MAELILKNFMEDCVERLIPKVTKNMGICNCERCTMDILAYALNNLPPKYIVTDKGHLFAKVNSMDIQFDTDIMTTIYAGAQIVGANPRHG